jgi:hypothetical protein
MLDTAQQVRLLEVFAEHESEISRLYETYASVFPDHRRFWNDLADDEANHADWVRSLVPLVEDGSLGLREDRFARAAIETSLRYIRRRAGEASVESPGFMKALVIALDIEDAMLEKRFFEIADEDTPEFRRVMNSLQRETERHRTALRTAREAAEKHGRQGTGG